ncbi:SH3 domain-containing protein [sulfur-oxidizing endosymbiont of Gigantopelta aegis]|uniref:SH3 domain-containing protein n=1 Tax=sulfur-oxidizing endosymbiont of Gigantopelta aegis TaxID=2794934 RepID=UPI001BE3E659|nr:SH3 domain-containing protein [sulfur-oxidizing endosymbiont of Gigantopelta aegis]
MLLISLSFSTVQAEEQQLKPNTKQNIKQKPSHYISPRLQLGLHTKPSLESPIVDLISSGTAVEVLKVEGAFSKIKNLVGNEGWVKNKFLTQDEPAILQLNTMRAALQRAQGFMKERLADGCPETNAAETKGSETNLTDEPAACPEVAEIPAVENLSEAEKMGYLATIAELKEEIKAWEQLDRQDRQAQKRQAEKNNQLLKEKLAMIASVAIGQNVDASQFDLTTIGELPEIQREHGSSLMKGIKKNYLLLIVVSGLSFLLGIFVMDLFNRRRHGGYRI